MLKEQLEEAEGTIKELRKELQGREERVEMQSVEGEGHSLILDQNYPPTTVMTPDRIPKASSLPAFLPIIPEPLDDVREPPTKKPCLMKEAKALGIGSHWGEKIGQRKRQRHIPYQH